MYELAEVVDMSIRCVMKSRPSVRNSRSGRDARPLGLQSSTTHARVPRDDGVKREDYVATLISMTSAVLRPAGTGRRNGRGQSCLDDLVLARLELYLLQAALSVPIGAPTGPARSARLLSPDFVRSATVTTSLDSLGPGPIVLPVKC